MKENLTMHIDRYESDLMASNMYIIQENGHAVVVDPYRNTEPGNGLIIDKIILTHEHYDHISGVNEWKRMTSAPVICSKACSENICNSRKNFASHFQEFCELQTWIEIARVPEYDPSYTCHADEGFEDMTSFEWMGHSCYLFEIPGHSQGSIGILLDNKYFFSGDSLLPGVETELRLPGGSKKKWAEIGKPRIDAVPRGVIVYPGHHREFKLENDVL